MEYSNLIYTEENGIGLLTIHRPKALNALNRQTMQELHTFFLQDAPRKAGLRGLIITGAGEKAFVAGADIKEFLQLDAAAGRDMARFGHEVFNAIEQFPKPIVAAVNGFALGGGCELAMACHLRIAGEKARFGQPEVKLGITPGYGGTQRLIQYIGKTKAMELLLTADMISAEEALRLGLVNKVVPAGEEVAQAKALLQKIIPNGPVAIAKIIELVNAYFRHDTDGLEREIRAFGETTGTEDFREGATAFIEKRAPEFKGR